MHRGPLLGLEPTNTPGRWLGAEGRLKRRCR
jgi:hypothetical protein